MVLLQCGFTPNRPKLSPECRQPSTQELWVVQAWLKPRRGLQRPCDLSRRSHWEMCYESAGLRSLAQKDKRVTKVWGLSRPWSDWEGLTSLCSLGSAPGSRWELPGFSPFSARLHPRSGPVMSSGVEGHGSERGLAVGGIPVSSHNHHLEDCSLQTHGRRCRFQMLLPQERAGGPWMKECCLC